MKLLTKEGNKKQRTKPRKLRVLGTMQTYKEQVKKDNDEKEAAKALAI